MELSTVEAADLQALLVGLGSREFDEPCVLSSLVALGRLARADYCAFLSLPSAGRPGPSFVSNNPPDFIPPYLSVFDRDFLTRRLVCEGREYIMRRRADWRAPENQDFIAVVQAARPVSDMAYFPARVGPRLLGYWAFGRAGADAPFYADADLERLRFALPFFDAALCRSLLPEGGEEDRGWLDKDGRLLEGGAAMEEAFGRAFGQGGRRGSEQAANWELFLAAYRHYLDGPMSPGMDRVMIPLGQALLAFLFCPLPLGGKSSLGRDLPRAGLRLLRVRAGGWPGASAQNGREEPCGLFTPREKEVIRGIYQGKSNKEIAYELRIDESTVKRHAHNIYEKGGFRSRVDLVLGLGLEEALNQPKV